MEDNKRLGKGLGAIFGDNIGDLIEEIQNSEDGSYGKRSDIDVSKIQANPYQPRKHFDEKAIEELAASVKQHGVFTPILVRESVTGYQLIAGERRLRATKLAGIDTIPAIIVDFNDDLMMEISLLENIQRENLNVIEEANAYKQMIDKLGYTQEQLAERIGKSRVHVSNTLRLLRLPTKIANMVIEGRLSMGHVRPLITLDDEEKMLVIANKAASENLSVREVEQLVKKPLVIKKPEEKTDIFVSDVVKKLEEKLQTRVKIEPKQITIKYSNNDDLSRIIEAILDEEE